ncbi:hypothetical protein AVEN_131511-1 [Araneus ventricosus]|uniref:Uncharacterized protein n=1 Tax=Araneus ventricosus TaxID=182803 RepID=A0A4Y2KEM4_ARAVE|nr:hypothetical protein AVEN_131511-1 [Araneus ventricosus]
MFTPNFKEVFEWVFKNERSTSMSRNKPGYLLFTLNSFATAPCESPRALSVRFHRAPRALDSAAFGISREFYQIFRIIRIPRNPNRGQTQRVRIPAGSTVLLILIRDVSKTRNIGEKNLDRHAIKEYN